MYKKCLNCGEKFTIKKWFPKQKFCSKPCHYTYKIKPVAWNKGLTKETDKRLKLVSEKVSATLKRKYKTGELINPNKGKKIPYRVRKGQKIADISHEESIKQEIVEYKNQGFRCINLSSTRPDFIAIKDNKVYAVEIEFHTPHYNKYNESEIYDDIIWIRYKRRDKNDFG